MLQELWSHGICPYHPRWHEECLTAIPDLFNTQRNSGKSLECSSRGRLVLARLERFRRWMEDDTQEDLFEELL